MTSIDVDESLREQSKLLLRKLKEKQSRLQNIVNTTASENNSSATNIREQFDTSLKKSISSKSAKDGRSRLQRRKTKSKEGKVQENLIRNNGKVTEDNKENLAKDHSMKMLQSKDIDLRPNRDEEPLSRDTNSDILSNIQKRVAGEMAMEYLKETGAFEGSETCTKSVETATPNTIRRRKIIDKNVKVNGRVDLNASELLKECEEDFPRLNYSYSNVEDSDFKFLQERLVANKEPKTDEVPERDIDTGKNDGQNYSDKLENPGNSRKIAKFIRETNKPKSILLSTSQRQNKSASGNSSKVSFRSPTRDTSGNGTYSMDSMSKQNQKMLGYDWIAALIENDPNAVNQSETFFEELKEFRKVNLDECVNDMYMDGPQELWEHPEREPLPVQKALEETRTKSKESYCHDPSGGVSIVCRHPEVKPYMVNDRLFTEPIQRSLFAGYDYQEPGQDQREKEGTYEEPRFVRVSVPRSTLMAPHRVKPHRRNSFDPTDTMALSEHCLKGWNTSKPSMMPTASNIGLRDSTLGIKSSMKTTLHDAETLAANYPYEWNPAEQTISRQLPKFTYRPESQYTDTTWPSSSVRDDTGPFSQSSKTLKRATDDLLNSTYSLMFEMQRLRKERSDDPLRV